MPIDNHGTWSRVLPFPLKDVLVMDRTDEPDGAITSPVIDFFPEDMDERIDIKLNLSFNEFTALASAIDIGRDIGYGENSALLWWIWLRAQKGICTVSCEDVLDCIETEPSIMTAITEQLISQGLVNPDIVNPDTTTIPMRFAGNAQSLEDEIGTLEDCNLDALWGAIRSGIVLYLDDNARTVLETLAAIADKGERAAGLLEFIPVIGTMLEEVVQQVIEIVPDLLTLFNSYSSESVLDEIACDLFELVCEECRFPTWEELFHYYASAGISGIDDIGALVLQAATDYLIGSTGLAALAAYHTIVTYQLFILYISSKFGGARGTSSIALWAGLGEDFASDNWIDLCDGCEPPAIVEPQISIGTCGAALGAPGGTSLTHLSGIRWRATSTLRPSSDWAVSITRVGGGTFHIDNVTTVSGSTPNFAGWQVDGGACSAGFAHPPLATTDWLMFMWTSNGTFTIDFDVFE